MSRHNRFKGVRGSDAFREWATGSKTVEQAFGRKEEPAVERKVWESPRHKILRLLRGKNHVELAGMGEGVVSFLADFMNGKETGPTEDEEGWYRFNPTKCMETAARALLAMEPGCIRKKDTRDARDGCILKCRLLIMDDDKEAKQELEELGPADLPALIMELKDWVRMENWNAARVIGWIAERNPGREEKEWAEAGFEIGRVLRLAGPSWRAGYRQELVLALEKMGPMAMGHLVPSGYMDKESEDMAMAAFRRMAEGPCLGAEAANELVKILCLRLLDTTYNWEHGMVQRTVRVAAEALGMRAVPELRGIMEQCIRDPRRRRMGAAASIMLEWIDAQNPGAFPEELKARVDRARIEAYL